MRRLMTWLVVLGFAMSTVGCAWTTPKKAVEPPAKTTTPAPATK